MTTGSHTVSFGNVSGYNTPSPKTVNIIESQTTTVTGTYPLVVQYGTLSVSTTPVAGDILIDGSLKGNGSWTGQLTVGSHTVSFGNVEGYQKPADKNVNIEAGQTTTVTGTYTLLSTFSLVIDSVMVTQTTIDQDEIGNGDVNRERIDLNQYQIDVRDRQELRFVCTCLDGSTDVSSSSQIDWYSGGTKLGSGNDIRITSLSPGPNQISVRASYLGKTANAAMSNPINVVPYPEIHFPFVGVWNNTASYYNDDTKDAAGVGDHGGKYALDFNAGVGGSADWGLPVLAPVGGTITRDIPLPAVIPSLPSTTWDGAISRKDWDRLGGLMIRSDNPSGYMFVLLHMSAIFITGGHVNQGQLIGLCGGKDGISGLLYPHIHFEMRAEDGSLPSVPEPVTDGNNTLIQEMTKNSSFVGQSSFTPDIFNYISEQEAQITGSFKSSGIFGFNHDGILSLSPQTTAAYVLGAFNAGDRLDQISLFVPYSEGEKGVTLQNVPHPPTTATAKLTFGNSVVWSSSNLSPSAKRSNFYEIPVSFALPQDGSVSLELQGNGMIFDEVRFHVAKAGSGGGGSESPRIVITRAKGVLGELIVDVFNPYSDDQTLSKMEILQSDSLGDTLRFDSQSITSVIPVDSLETISIPWASLSDSTLVTVTVYTQGGAVDAAFVDLTNMNLVRASQIPSSYSLDQNYPNPFNPTTIIRFSIPKRSFVILKIYDALSREVATLVNEEKLPGRYEVTFDGSRHPSGIYFYRIQAGSFRQIRKLVLLK